MDKLKCGACGEEKHTLSRSDDSKRIETTCCECGVVSVIQINPSSLVIGWSDPPGDGVLTGGWNVGEIRKSSR